MIFAGLMVLAALVFAPGWLPGVFALLAALQFLLEGIFVEITPARYLLIVAFVLAAPAAAYVAGAFLDSFTSESAKTDRFRGVSVVLAFCLMLQSEQVWDHLEAALVVSSNASVPQVVALAGAALSAVVFCGSVTAFVLIMIHLVCEIPVLWVTGAFRVEAFYAFAALRPLSVILAASLFFSFILQRFALDLTAHSISAGLSG